MLFTSDCIASLPLRFASITRRHALIVSISPRSFAAFERAPSCISQQSIWRLCGHAQAARLVLDCAKWLRVHCCKLPPRKPTNTAGSFKVMTIKQLLRKSHQFYRCASRWPKLACGRQRGLRHGADLITRKVDPKHVLEPTFFANQQSCLDGSRRGLDRGIEGLGSNFAFFGSGWLRYLFEAQGCNLYRQQPNSCLESSELDHRHEKFRHC